MLCASSPTTVTPSPGRLHGQDDLGLQAVGVLVFVDQQVIETLADFLRQRGSAIISAQNSSRSS